MLKIIQMLIECIKLFFFMLQLINVLLMFSKIDVHIIDSSLQRRNIKFIINHDCIEENFNEITAEWSILDFFQTEIKEIQ